MYRTVIAIAVAASAVSSAAEPPKKAGPAPATTIPDIPYTKFVLKNGLTLLVHEDHKAPIVAVNVWYHVGSKNEKAGKTGFAHLFEHLMFNGSEHFNDDFFKAVEPIGATDLNGTTNEDRTNYFQNVPVSALDRVLWLESDRMGHLLGVIDKARLDEQRGVVQNEKRQGENEPYGKTWITIAENTYPKGHPYSWSVIGSMEDLNAASLADVKEWFTTYYGAANATLVIAGDVKPDDVLKRVERHFGDIPSGPPVIRHQAWVAKMSGEHRMVVEDRVPQARLMKVWNVPQRGTADAVYMDLITDLLAGGKPSRLYKRLVHKDRTATSVAGYIDVRELSSQVILMADVQPGGDLAAVEKAMDEELAAFLAAGPTPDEVERVRTQSRANFARGIERIGGFGGKSDQLAQGMVFLGDPEAYKKDERLKAAATAADLSGAANRWMKDGVFVLEVHPFAERSTAKSDVDRKKLPDPGPTPSAPLPPAEKASLPNGLKILLVRRTAVPIVQARLVLEGGFAADKPTMPGVGTMAMYMLSEGTTTRSSLELADQLAVLGAAFWTANRIDGSTAELNVLVDKLDPALELFADMLLNPSFPQQDLDREKKRTLALIQQEKVEPLSIALRVLPGLLYGEGHAYAQPLTGTGTEASVQAMTRDDLVAYHRAWVRPNKATLIVVGDITMAELLPKLERVFKGWKAGDVPAKNIGVVPPRTKDQLYVVDRPGAEQSIILVGQLVAPRNNPDEFAFQTFNDAFGGAFTARVNMNLREGKHWSYGAYSFAMDARGQRLWAIYAPVQTDKTKESIAELVKELKGVASTKPLTAKELQEAKDRQTRTLAGRWETGRAAGSAFEEIVTYELPEDFYVTWADKVRAVQPADVQRAVAKNLTPGKLVFVVVGDRAKIEAGLKQLNLGEPQELDGDGHPKKK